MKNVWWEVVPRYTPGSPALVSRDIALRVAEQERAAYKRIVLNPGAVPRETATANQLGLGGIVWSWYQHGNQIEWRDELTEEDGTLIVRRNQPIRWPWSKRKGDDHAV